MAYEKTLWEAREGSQLNRFGKEQETSSSVILSNQPKNVTKKGTPFSVDNMNHIENGIYEAHQLIEVQTQDLTAHKTDDTAHGDIRQKIYIEAQTREDIDNLLQQKISTETQTREADVQNLKAADVTLQGNLNTTNENLKEEADARDKQITEAITGEANFRQGQINELNNEIQKTNNVLAGVHTTSLNGAILTRALGGFTEIQKSLFSNEVVFMVGKTLLFDKYGTVGVYIGDVDQATLNIMTKATSPVSELEPTLLGSVQLFEELPLTVTDAENLWGRTPRLDDFAHVKTDDNFDGLRVEYYITSIDGQGNITWGNPVPINTADFQAQTGAEDAGKVLVGGAMPGTFGNSIPIDLEPTEDSRNLITSGAIFPLTKNKVPLGTIIRTTFNNDEERLAATLGGSWGGFPSSQSDAHQASNQQTLSWNGYLDDDGQTYNKDVIINGAQLPIRILNREKIIPGTNIEFAFGFNFISVVDKPPIVGNNSNPVPGSLTVSYYSSKRGLLATQNISFSFYTYQSGSQGQYVSFYSDCSIGAKIPFFLHDPLDEFYAVFSNVVKPNYSWLRISSCGSVFNIRINPSYNWIRIS